MKHLEPRQYYIDLYDEITISQCREAEKSMDEMEIPETIEGKPVKKEESEKVRSYFIKMRMYFLTGHRYERKEKTIAEWMKRDKEKDKLLDSTNAPENICCLKCGKEMVANFKDLFEVDGRERILFMYDCPNKCLPRRAFYENGDERIPKPSLCPKCNKPLEEQHQRNEKVITTFKKCLSCKHIETETLDLSPEEKPIDKDFEKDRARFCLSEKEGQKFISAKHQLEEIGKIFDEQKEREKNKDLYGKINKLKKLTIVDLEKLLSPILARSGYIKLKFGDPEVNKDVFLPFTVYDEKSDRRDRASSSELEKTLKKTLINTNWRLMSEGASYRLGMLTGRLRAYEREEDLLKLVKSPKKPTK